MRIVTNHCGKPCPPLEEIADQIQLTVTEVAELLIAVERTGLLEIERGDARVRMRLKGGKWTGWSRPRVACSLSRER
jgi:hypothetical protein